MKTRVHRSALHQEGSPGLRYFLNKKSKIMIIKSKIMIIFLYCDKRLLTPGTVMNSVMNWVTFFKTNLRSA